MTGLKRTLGVCYYPEHWDPAEWPADAAAMREAGLTWVRIGEFAWSRIEAQPGVLTWDWLDRAIDVLTNAGLQVVLGTPTATPPRWMLHRHPDMLAVDAEGRPRGFGSRRHYCFSHPGYFEEARRITTLMAERYGPTGKIAAWQTDNEYGCHDTVLSYSEASKTAFQAWLKARYGNIDALNTAWGNVFWSMDYADFDEIGLPNLTVTEPNPAHALAFRRFSSDQVVRFNRMQVDAIRAHSAAPIAHNYMGRVTEFDHHKTGDDLEIASWDSYPLGFLEERVPASPAHQRQFARQGDPDFQAFHHDLYRGVGRGRWWIMEQQPGPVNWAPYNPAPLKGMVRLWSWEAFAHGAEAVCYFRWRQAPFAQEQMHAGLLRPDRVAAPGLVEARKVAEEIAAAPAVSAPKANAALIFDYDADWAWTVQPHGAGLSYFDLVFAHYRALRRAGLNIDILRPEPAVLEGYPIVVAPGLMHMPEDLKTALAAHPGQVLVGPRSGARTVDFEIPAGLAPGLPDWDLVVTRVESLRPDMPIEIDGDGQVRGYLEYLDGAGEPVLTSRCGVPVALRRERMIYMGGYGDAAALDRLVAALCLAADLPHRTLPEGIRVRDTGEERFWFNYTAEVAQTPDGPIEAAGVLRVPRDGGETAR